MPETVNPQESVFMKPLIFLLPAVLSLHAAAQNYVIADDRLSSGVLTLKGSSFSVSTVNPNGNVCDYEGIVRNRIASDGEGCVVHFSFKRDSVRLDIPESAREACQSYCGHNAFFDRVYYKMPKCRRPAPRNMQRRRSGVSKPPIGTNVSERRQTSNGNI